MTVPLYRKWICVSGSRYALHSINRVEKRRSAWQVCRAAGNK